MKLINTSTILAASGALLLAASANAVDAPKDVVKSSAGRVWVNSFNNCVVTKWDANVNECDAGVGGNLELRSVYFDFDSAVLTTEAQMKLDQLSEVINSSAAIADVRIHGFTDQFGTSSYNEVLANKRAGAVKTYLDGKSRLSSTVAEVKGLGKSSPAEGCESMKKRDEKIACMAKERRVEIEFKAQR